MVEFHVLRCADCETFQVSQVTKSSKWKCKLCGLRQSLLKVYGQGSGADCRRHVQKLNSLRGQLEQTVEERHLLQPSGFERARTKESSISGFNRPAEENKRSRWSEFIESPKSEEENEAVNQDTDDANHPFLVTTDKAEFHLTKKTFIKRKRAPLDDTELLGTKHASINPVKKFRKHFTGIVATSHHSHSEDNHKKTQRSFNTGLSKPSSATVNSNITKSERNEGNGLPKFHHLLKPSIGKICQRSFGPGADQLASDLTKIGSKKTATPKMSNSRVNAESKWLDFLENDATSDDDIDDNDEFGFDNYVKDNIDPNKGLLIEASDLFPQLESQPSSGKRGYIITQISDQRDQARLPLCDVKVQRERDHSALTSSLGDPNKRPLTTTLDHHIEKRRHQPLNNNAELENQISDLKAHTRSSLSDMMELRRPGDGTLISSKEYPGCTTGLVEPLNDVAGIFDLNFDIDLDHLDL